MGNTDLQMTVTALDKAAATFIKLAQQVERLSDKLDKIDGKVVKFTVKGEGVEKADAELDNVERKVKNLDGKKARVKVDVDKSLGDSLIQFNLLGRALKAIALPASLVTAAPQIASLGAAAVSATGAIGALPAAVGAAGLAAGVASVSFGNLIKYFTASSDKKKTEAYNALSASGKKLADTISGLTPRFEALRHATQDAVFEGLTKEVRPLADRYLPALQREMVATGQVFNSASITLAKFFEQKSASNDLTASLTSMRVAVGNIVLAATPLAHVFVDVLTTGAARLPGLTQGIAGAAAKLADFVSKARESGQLGEWMDVGIAKVEQLGRIALNTGGILMSIFKAGTASGADFLGTVERITGGVNAFLRSSEGQGALVALFKEIRATVDALAPGFQALGSAVAYVVSQLAQAGVLHEAGAAISALVISVAPLARYLGDLAANILPPVLQLIGAIAPVLGPVVAAFVAWKVASAGMSVVQTAVKGAAESIAWASLKAEEFATKAGMSSAAGEKMANAGEKVSGKMSQLGNALPLIGIGIAGITTAYDIWGGKADEAATKVVNGSMSMRQAIAQEAEQIHSNQIEWLGGMNAQESYAAAARNVQVELDKQMATLSPMEQLQARVAMAQANLNDAVAQYGPKSQQAVSAAAELNAARDREKAATDGAKQAEQSLGDAIVDTSNKASAAANADVAYQQGLLSLANASDRAAEAAWSHAAGSREVTEANLAVQQASLSAADAARRKAQSDAEARGASDAAAIGAQAYKDELQRQADTLEGPAKQAALNNIALLGGQKGASDTARTAANLYKGELQSLADKENGPLKDAILGTIRNFDSLGGAHATAEQKAAAQRAALVRLADQAQGPTRDAILAMIRTIDQIHDKSYTITGTGVVNGIRSTTGSTAPGAGAHARGGIIDSLADGGVLSGYTPGRDVHTFRSATGGVLQLSGGEAVMRPEWTQAVGPDYVKAANRAARQGGIAGVSDFMSRTAPRRGEGVRGDGNAFANGGIIGGRYAGGGVVMRGVPYPDIPPQLEAGIQGSLLSKMNPILIAMIKAAEAAAAGGVSGVAGGGAQAALAWARTQVGKPYIWGGVGPRGYDCSGFQSAVLNVLQGRNPYSRRGATGNFPWAGFAPGLGGQYAIGAYRGNPGHMAGTLAPGVNVESSGGVGVRVGGGARGANNGMFNIRGHIGDTGGLLPPGEAVINLSGGLERVLSTEQTRVLDQILAAVSGGRQSGGGAGELGGLLRAVAGHLSALRGDVDHHGDNAAIVASIGVTNRLLAGAVSGTAAGSAQTHRTIGELGPW
jgi:hypothetical protein